MSSLQRPKFSIKRHTLGAMLDKASGALGSAGDIDILQYFKFVLDDSGLRIVSTDIDLTVLAQTSNVDIDVPGSFVVIADKLRKLVRLLELDDVVNFEVEERFRVHVFTSDVSWHLSGADPSEYPEVPDPSQVTWFTADREKFKNALRKVYPAAPIDGMRNVNMMIVDVTEHVVRATDGVRFAAMDIEFPFPIQLPIKSVPELLKFLSKAVSDQIYVASTDEVVLFKVDDDILMLTRIEIDFVDVSVIMKDVASNDRLLVVDRLSFIRALNRVKINADPDTNQVVLVAKRDGSYLYTSSKSGEDSKHTVLTDWPYDFEQTVIVNIDFLIDAVVAHDTPALTLALPSNESGPIAVIGDRGLVTIIRQFRRNI